MRTFLPYPNFSASIEVLDDKQLGQQRMDALQLLHIIKKPIYTCRWCGTSLDGVTDYPPCNLRGKNKPCQPAGTPWANHPAVTMWRGYPEALENYLHTAIEEWKRRGFANTMFAEYHQVATYPKWLGDEAFHASHRSNLLRKNPEHYGKFNWKETPDLPYVWPS